MTGVQTCALPISSEYFFPYITLPLLPTFPHPSLCPCTSHPFPLPLSSLFSTLPHPSLSRVPFYFPRSVLFAGSSGLLLPSTPRLDRYCSVSELTLIYCTCCTILYSISHSPPNLPPLSPPSPLLSSLSSPLLPPHLSRCLLTTFIAAQTWSASSSAPPSCPHRHRIRSGPCKSRHLFFLSFFSSSFSLTPHCP